MRKFTLDISVLLVLLMGCRQEASPSGTETIEPKEGSEDHGEVTEHQKEVSAQKDDVALVDLEDSENLDTLSEDVGAEDLSLDASYEKATDKGKPGYDVPGEFADAGGQDSSIDVASNDLYQLDSSGVEDVGTKIIPPCTVVPCKCTESDAVFEGSCSYTFRPISCVDGKPDYVFVDCDGPVIENCDPCNAWGSTDDPLKPCVSFVGSNPCVGGPPYPRILIALHENVKPCVLGCCSLVDGLPHWNLPLDPATGACVEQ